MSEKITPFMNRMHAVDAIRETWPITAGDVRNMNTVTDQILSLVDAGISTDKIEITKKENSYSVEISMKKEDIQEGMNEILDGIKKVNSELFYLPSNGDRTNFNKLLGVSDNLILAMKTLVQMDIKESVAVKSVLEETVQEEMNQVGGPQ